MTLMLTLRDIIALVLIVMTIGFFTYAHWQSRND